MVNKFTNQKGITLVEIIIAVAISSLVILIVYSMFLTGKEAYQKGEANAEVLQNGRVSLERMTREIRQAQDVVTDLTSPADQIEFHDGHLTFATEEDLVQGAGASTITFNATASAQDDYYENMFVRLYKGGYEEFKKIIDYDGSTKIATVDSDWAIIPDGTYNYKIDSAYYYIRYYLDGNNLRRQIKAYRFISGPSEDLNAFVPQGVVDEDGDDPDLLELENRVIAEYITNIEILGDDLISIALEIQKNQKILDLSTKVWGRNL